MLSAGRRQEESTKDGLDGCFAPGGLGVDAAAGEPAARRSQQAGPRLVCRLRPRLARLVLVAGCLSNRRNLATQGLCSMCCE